MTIKNKDGSVFKLVGPNPMAKNQHIWNETEDDCIVENMKWASLILPDEREASRFNTDLKVPEDASIDTEEELIVEPKEEIKEITPEVPIPVVTPEIKETAQPKTKLKNIVDIWCLPAVLREHVDELYGSKQFTIEYLERLMFEGIIVENTGLSMLFWTNIDTPQRGSVVFISRNSEGHGFNEKRWWKVDNVIDSTQDSRLEESGGYLFHCVPSEYTPYFE